MEKEKYIRAEMTVTTFKAEDVLTSSEILVDPTLEGNDLQLLG